MENKCFVLEKPGVVRFEIRPRPEITSPHDVIVLVSYTGICGSDVHYWQHGKIGPFAVRAPLVLGHESSGIVYDVGSSVTTLKVGDLVAMEPGIPCRRCARCKEGRYNLCPDIAFAATPPYDGTLAKYFKLPEDFCYRLPEGMSLQEGAIVEPASVAVHACRQGDVRSGAAVVVFGAGPVGLLCCAVAKAFGAKKVVSVDINEERLRFALKYAATDVVRSQGDLESPQDGAKRMVADLGLAPGVDVAIDASGAEACIMTALHALRTGGTYVQAGMGKDELIWPIGVMGAKELTVKGSFRYSAGDYKIAIDLISSGRINASVLISEEVDFDEAEKAFQAVKQTDGIKYLIKGPKVDN